MTTLILKDLIFRIRMKLGNVSSLQLSPFILMENLYSAINKRLAQLRLSSQNYQMKSFYLTALEGKREYNIPASDFGREVMVEAFDTNGNFIDQVEMQNMTNLPRIMDSMESNKMAISFYKTDTGISKAILAGAPNMSRIKVWYEPDTPIARQLAMALPLNSMYSDIVVIDCSLSCLPHINFTAQSTEAEVMLDRGKKKDIRDDLLLNKAEWEALWADEIESSKTQTRVIRTPFIAGR